jgi:putative ABC transport system permease protein
MLKNYLITAIRNLLRYKAFTFINVLSLTIGMVSCLVIGLFVIHERSFDKFFPEHQQVFRVYNETKGEEGVSLRAGVPPMYATTLNQDFPEVENTLRIMIGVGTSDKKLFEAGDVQSYEENGIAAENSFFDFFPLSLTGDASRTFSEPNTIVLRSEMAKKFFGSTQVVGKTINMNKVPFKITGVINEVPDNFHLDFNFIYSFASKEVPPERMQSWMWQQFYTYVKLKKGVSAENVENKFRQVVVAKSDPVTAVRNFKQIPHLQPQASIHLTSSQLVFDDHVKAGNLAYVNGLAVIGIFVLFIACFNFVNLATARSSRRAKEIGVRKVIGAGRPQLVFQFIGETILLSVISIFVAAGIMMLLLEPLNTFTGKSIQFNPFKDPVLALILLGAGIILGTLAGLYPAFFLSRFRPIQVLKSSGQGSGKVRHAWVRQGLVVIQFALSTLLIICTLVVYDQMKFLNNKELGFDKEQVVLFQLRGDIENRIDALKTALLQSPDIASVTAGYGFPGDMLAGDEVVVPRQNNKPYGITHLLADHDYAKTLGLDFVAGRDFSRDRASDVERGFILNEAAVSLMGLGSPEKALGEPLNWRKWFGEGDSIKRGEVIGVVKDLHLTSLHEKVRPTVIHIFPVYFQMAVKVKSSDLQSSLGFIESTWKKFNEQYPFEYKFLDDNFNKMYLAEEKLSTLLWIFTALAIFIGCLGLFGLAAFAAEQRTKEISIRKVLGASITQIAYQLSKNFLLLVLIASVIAVPVAWWAMNNWLEDFPYKINISAWYFIITIVIALVVALITISFQSIRAAVANPVKSLKAE